MQTIIDVKKIGVEESISTLFLSNGLMLDPKHVSRVVEKIDNDFDEIFALDGGDD